MRTTVDLPDELYRTLKARAAISGVTLRDLIQGLIEQGLAYPSASSTGPADAEMTLPVAIPSTGRTIKLTNEDIRQIEEEEDIERYVRSSRR